MRILHISDTHGHHNELPPIKGVDMVIHSGDCSNYYDTARNSEEVWRFLEWYQQVPVEHKVFVAGNHDTSIERRLHTKADMAARGITYLEHEDITINGLKIFGSPYTPTYGDWAFMKARGKMHDLWQHIPTDTDILVTHGPAQGVRDLTQERDGSYKQCGDLSLTKWIFSFRPKAHLFGHIHDMDGIHNQGISRYSKCPTIFSNGACVHDGRFDKGLTSLGNIIEL